MVAPHEEAPQDIVALLSLSDEELFARMAPEADYAAGDDPVVIGRRHFFAEFRVHKGTICHMPAVRAFLKSDRVGDTASLAAAIADMLGLMGKATFAVLCVRCGLNHLCEEALSGQGYAPGP
jgi:hypothetical protein